MKKMIAIIGSAFAFLILSSQESTEAKIKNLGEQGIHESGTSPLLEEIKSDQKMIEHNRLKVDYSKNIQETLAVTYQAVELAKESRR